VTRLTQCTAAANVVKVMIVVGEVAHPSPPAVFRSTSVLKSSARGRRLWRAHSRVRKANRPRSAQRGEGA